VSLYAYCLMPNHVHLLIQTVDAPLSKFMQGVQQSYTQWFNRTYEKVGHLFQGRYKAIICDREEYLTTLVRYIHLNPVRAGLVDDPARYPYSGHAAYLTGDGRELIDSTPVLSLLGGCARYRRFVLAGIDGSHQEQYYPAEGQPFLGPPGFADRMRPPTLRTAGAVPRRPIAAVLSEMARRLAVHPSTLCGPDRSQRVSQARAAVSLVLVRGLGYRVADVAAALSRDAATICTTVSRLARRINSGDRAATRDVVRLDGIV
jgi:putative transposase